MSLLSFEHRLVSWYWQRAEAPWEFWFAAGSPPQFRPRLRWSLVPLGLALGFFGFLPPVRRPFVRRQRPERFAGVLHM